MRIARDVDQVLAIKLTYEARLPVAALVLFLREILDRHPADTNLFFVYHEGRPVAGVVLAPALKRLGRTVPARRHGSWCARQSLAKGDRSDVK